MLTNILIPLCALALYLLIIITANQIKLREIQLLHGAFGGQVCARTPELMHAFRYREYDFTIKLFSFTSIIPYFPHTHGFGVTTVAITIHPKIQNVCFEIRRKTRLLTLLKNFQLRPTAMDGADSSFYVYGNVSNYAEFALNDPALTSRLDELLSTSLTCIRCDTLGITFARGRAWPWESKQLIEPAIIKHILEQLICVHKRLNG